MLPARLPGAHPIPGRKHHAHSAHRRRREVRSHPHAGTKHSGHGRDPTPTDEYVAIGAARQAAWVLSGETEPPAWQLTIDGVETGEPTEAVYEAYAKARG